MMGTKEEVDRRKVIRNASCLSRDLLNEYIFAKAIIQTWKWFDMTQGEKKITQSYPYINDWLNNPSSAIKLT